MEERKSIRTFFEKRREIILYLIFGGLTTVVGWGVYFAVMYLGRAVFSIPVDDVTGGRYLALYVTAQIIQWIAAVLFAFFTNRSFVFQDGRKGRLFRQFSVFAGGRVASFVLDLFVTYFGALLCSFLFPSLNAVMLLGREWNLNEIGAKFVAAIIVIVSNYFFNKLLVFRQRQ